MSIDIIVSPVIFIYIGQSLRCYGTVDHCCIAYVHIYVFHDQDILELTPLLTKKANFDAQYSQLIT